MVPNLDYIVGLHIGEKDIRAENLEERYQIYNVIVKLWYHLTAQNKFWQLKDIIIINTILLNQYHFIKSIPFY